MKKTSIFFATGLFSLLVCFASAQTRNGSSISITEENAILSDLSCEPGAGWVEHKLAATQWNQVGNLSQLEAVDNSTIFYISSNNYVCVVYRSGNSWEDGQLNSAFQKASITGGLLHISGGEYDGVYYVGTDQKIYRFNYTQYGWIANRVSPSQWNNVLPSSELLFHGGQIFYINTSRQVCALYKSNGVWYDSILSSSGQKSVNNGRGLAYSSVADIVYVGEDNYIWRYYWGGNGWICQKVCAGQWNKVLTGSPLLASEDGTQIMYINTNNQLCALYRGGNNWYDSIINSAVKVNSNSYLTRGDAVYFIGIDNNVYRVTYSNGWRYQALIQTSFCQTLGKSGIVSRGDQIYYTGTDNYIHGLEYIQPRSSWTEAQDAGFTDNAYNSVKEPSAEISAYPNPAGHTVTFRLPEGEHYRLQLLTVNGSMVKNMSFDGDHYQMDCSDLPAGIYFARIAGSTEVYNSKIVIQR